MSKTEMELAAAVAGELAHIIPGYSGYATLVYLQPADRNAILNGLKRLVTVMQEDRTASAMPDEVDAAFDALHRIVSTPPVEKVAGSPPMVWQAMHAYLYLLNHARGAYAGGFPTWFGPTPAELVKQVLAAFSTRAFPPAPASFLELPWTEADAMRWCAANEATVRWGYGGARQPKKVTVSVLGPDPEATAGEQRRITYRAEGTDLAEVAKGLNARVCAGTG